MVITIREALPEDIKAIYTLNQDAFDQPDESKLIDLLREQGGVLLSLVAVLNEEVVGHILYSPVTIENKGETIIGAGLGPMAVLPQYQRQGIGSRLVEAGNQALLKSGYPFIVVLGHPEYYPRFGFKSASSCGLKCEWDVPDDVFMILVNDEVKKQDNTGLVRYRPEFSMVS